MLLFFLFFAFALGAGKEPLWGQRGRDSKSSNHSPYNLGNTKEWAMRFDNMSEPMGRNEIILDPLNGYIYALGCIGYEDECYIFIVSADTGRLLDSRKLVNTEFKARTFDYDYITPLLTSGSSPYYEQYLFMARTYKQRNNSWWSSLSLHQGGADAMYWMPGQFDGQMALHEDTLIYMAQAENPYYLFHDIFAYKITDTFTKPELVWRVPNAFVEDDVVEGSPLSMGPDGFFYFKNQTFGGVQRKSFFQKFDAKTGQSVASQNPVYQTFDSKPVVSENLEPNRVCYTSHTPKEEDDTTTRNPLNQRILTCLNSETMEVMFEQSIEPAQKESTSWYRFNPSMSLDEKEIYVANGYYGMTTVSTTTLWVFSTEDGKAIEKYDVGHKCSTHDVPFAVFSANSKWRFAIACTDDDKEEFNLYAMDRDGNVKMKKGGSVVMVPEYNYIQLITDEKDCVYYCWYERIGVFPAYTNIMRCGKSCF